jgi:hypothetical protein
MMQNILVGVLAVLAIGAGIFGWWLENRNTKQNPEAKSPSTKQNN